MNSTLGSFRGVAFHSVFNTIYVLFYLDLIVELDYDLSFHVDDLLDRRES